MGHEGRRIAVLALAFAILICFVVNDPFQVSFLSNAPDFHPHYVSWPLSNPLRNIPWDSRDKLQLSEIIGRGEIFGPESVAFDTQGRGPYTSLSDGRVVRYENGTWRTFATTSAARSSICDYKATPTPQLMYEHACGRPLGLRFHQTTGELYIADAYLGILKVAPEGGMAQPVVTQLDGEPFKLCNDLDFDDDGNLYFTDSSHRYGRRQFFLSRLELEDTGRFLKYNPHTRQTTVLMDGLRFPNGVAVSKDDTFVVVAESNMARLLKYWLKGPKAQTWEVWIDLPGVPDNVRRNANGHFWVAFNARRTTVEIYSGAVPWLRRFVAQLPVPRTWFVALIERIGYVLKPHGLIIRYSAEGQLLEVLEDRSGTVVKAVSEVEEHDGKLYIGSVMFPQMAIYTLPSHR